MIALSRELFGNSITLRVTEDPEWDWTHIGIQARSADGNLSRRRWRSKYDGANILLESIGDAAYSFTLLAGFNDCGSALPTSGQRKRPSPCLA